MPLLFLFFLEKIIYSYKIRTDKKEKPLKIAVFLVFGGDGGIRLYCPRLTLAVLCVSVFLVFKPFLALAFDFNRVQKCKIKNYSYKIRTIFKEKLH